MTKITLTGILKTIELKISQQGTAYLNLSVEDRFIKKDGTLQVITQYVSCFSDYAIQQFQDGAYPINNAVIIEGNVSADTYDSNGITKAKLNIVANSINVIVVSQAPAQQPMQQQMVQQPMVQQPMVQQNPQMFATQDITNQVNHGMYQQPIQQPTQQGQVQGQTTIGNTNIKW